MEPVQIFVRKSWNGQVKVFDINKHASVDDLFQRTATVCEIPGQDFRLTHSGHHLERHGELLLADHGIVGNSTVSVSLFLRGGVNPMDQMRLKKHGLQPLPGFITVTFEEDMLGLEDDPNEKRAKMPCGHVIAPSSMTAFARSLLERRDRPYRFVCPEFKCEREWDYFLVRHVACLTEEEQKEFEAKISENYMLKTGGIQQCPGCGVYCERTDNRNNAVRCRLCSKEEAPYDFCWACLRPWEAAGPGKKCGNAECDGVDPRLKYLKNCPKKEIEFSKGETPTIRGCPKCGMLIEHTIACKHMKCTMCGHNYCHVCLKGKAEGGLGWECGSYICSAAPPQTSLPGML